MKVDMKDNKPKSTARRLANICLLCLLIAIVAALVIDVLTLFEVAMQFAASIIASAFIFVLLFMAMIASCIFIFGVVLLEKYGFWPLTITFDAFKQMIGEIQIDPTKLAIFRGARIGLIVVCAIVFVMAIVAKSMAKVHKNENEIKIYRSAKRKSKTAIVFAVLGILISVGALLITSKI